jgi:phosphate transport system substrate-binding protein
MRSKRIVAAVLLAASLAVLVAACGSDDSSGGGSGGSSGGSKLSGSINGAGATFPLPVYQEWAARLKEKQGLTVNYQGIGSGGGIAQFTAGTVDFGATDSAMEDEEIAAAKKKGDPVHIPSVFGAVTVSYNVKGVEKGLKLAYSPEWKNGPGVDKTVKWPTGTGAKGNDGVAACVKQNDGAVGYVEQAYALANSFTFADLKNKAGNFVAPTLESTSAAGDGLKVPDDLRFSAIDAPGDQAYPIASGTFLLVYQDMCKAGLSEEKAKLVKGFLDYALSDGQSVAKELQYAALPEAIHTAAQKKVAGLTCNGSPIASS